MKLPESINRETKVKLLMKQVKQKLTIDQSAVTFTGSKKLNVTVEV